MLSRVELCVCVCVSAVCTHPSAVVTQFTILQPICDWRRKLETGSRDWCVHTADTTELDFVVGRRPAYSRHTTKSAFLAQAQPTQRELRSNDLDRVLKSSNIIQTRKLCYSKDDRAMRAI